ncbi:MAG: hypothetical protein U5J98_06835 [Halobacteriales archaeon]|nr:hypothetical protein [Halobacteriales archaeon]
MPATSKPTGRPDSPPRGELHIIDSRVKKWRFKCPNKPHHDDWRLWDGVFCCQTCKQLRDSGRRDVQSVFDHLWDAKEGQLVPRERIRIET